VDQGAQSQNELDTARNKLETAIATLNAADKDVIASQASVNQAQAQAQVAANQVNLKKKSLHRSTVNFSIKAGDYVSVGQPWSRLSKMTLDMRLSVPSNNLAQLRQVASRATRC